MRADAEAYKDPFRQQAADLIEALQARVRDLESEEIALRNVAKNYIAERDAALSAAAALREALEEIACEPIGPGELEDVRMVFERRKPMMERVRAVLASTAQAAHARDERLRQEGREQGWARFSDLHHIAEVVLLPMALGYAREHPVGRNAEMCADAQRILGAWRDAARTAPAGTEGAGA